MQSQTIYLSGQKPTSTNESFSEPNLTPQQLVSHRSITGLLRIFDNASDIGIIPVGPRNAPFVLAAPSLNPVWTFNAQGYYNFLYMFGDLYTYYSGSIDVTFNFASNFNVSGLLIMVPIPLDVHDSVIASLGDFVSQLTPSPLDPTLSTARRLELRTAQLQFLTNMPHTIVNLNTCRNVTINVPYISRKTRTPRNLDYSNLYIYGVGLKFPAGMDELHATVSYSAGKDFKYHLFSGVPVLNSYHPTGYSETRSESSELD